MGLTMRFSGAVCVTLVLAHVGAVLPAVLQARAAAQPADDEALFDVPKTLLIGAGLSAMQSEGALHQDGKVQSVLDYNIHQLSNDYKENHDVAADHYNRFKEDLALAKQMKFTSHRFSIPWSRILPTEDAKVNKTAAVQHYHDYIDEIRANGMEPMVTMYHFDHPVEIERSTGGWPSEAMVDKFVEYATFLFEEYGSKVKYWNPINEGNMYCIFMLPELQDSGLTKMDDTSYYKCLHNTILAHAKTYRVYQKYFKDSQKGQVGTSVLLWPATPATTSYEDVTAANLLNDVFGGTPVHPIVYGGEYPGITRFIVDKNSKAEGRNESRLPRFTDAQKKELFYDVPSDFLGLNVYSGYSVAMSRNASDKGKNGMFLHPVIDDLPQVKIVSGGGFGGIDPELMKTSLLWAWTKYHLPIIITENGFGDSTHQGVHDSDRAAYHSATLRSLVKTMNEYGVPVISYHTWSLLDVFEFTAGYEGRPFGLVHVDYANKTLTRTLKDSSKLFIEVAETRHVPYIAKTSSASGTSLLAPSVLVAALLSTFMRSQRSAA